MRLPAQSSKMGVISYPMPISTQVPIRYKKFGGVVPEIASRHHIEDVLPVAIEALEEAHLDWQDIDAIAVTQGPARGRTAGRCRSGEIRGMGTRKTADHAVNHMEGISLRIFFSIRIWNRHSLRSSSSGGHTMIV